MCKKYLIINMIVVMVFATNLFAQDGELKEKIDQLANQIEPKVIEWRRHFHQYPELSNREFNTAEKVLLAFCVAVNRVR